MSTISWLARSTRQASPLIVGRLASATLTFFLPLWLARVLDPSAFGTYKQLFLVLQSTLFIGQLGLTQSLYYFLPSGERDRGAYVTQALIGLGSVALLASVSLWLAAPTLAHHLGDGGLLALRLPLAVMALGFLATAPLEGALVSEGRVGWAAATYVVGDGLRAALLLAGALHGGVVGLAWGGAAYLGVRTLALGTLLATRIIPTAPPSLAMARRQLGYALPFAGAVVLYVAQKQLAQYLVAARFDAATFALYAVAMFHIPVLDIVYTPLCDVMMLRLGKARARGDTAQARVEWNDTVGKLATLLWPATACAWLLGPRILPILFTTRYAASVPLFLLATFEIPLWALPVDGLLRAAGDTRFLLAWNGARAAITAALVLAGMHLFGVAGALGGSVASEGLSRIVMLLRGRRHLQVTGRRVVELGRLGRIATATAGASAVTWGVAHLVPGRTGILVAAAAFGASYIALMRPRRQGDAPALAGGNAITATTIAPAPAAR